MLVYGYMHSCILFIKAKVMFSVKAQCVVPENIHTPQGWSMEIPRGSGGGLKGRNFQGVWGVGHVKYFQEA